MTGPFAQAAAIYQSRDWCPIPCCWPSVSGACGCGWGHQGKEIGKAPLPEHDPHVAPSAETVTRWALLALGPGTPLVVLGRISAREWQAPGGQAKTFLEVVGESVTIGVETIGAGGESREVPSSGSRPGAEPAAPPRPSSARSASRDSVPF